MVHPMSTHNIKAVNNNTVFGHKRDSNVFLITCIQDHDVIAMGIDITQWRIQIARLWKYAGRRRHSRRKTQGVKTASATTCNPLLVLMSFCLITAPFLLLVAGDVERNPGPPKLQSKCDSRHELFCMSD